VDIKYAARRSKKKKEVRSRLGGSAAWRGGKAEGKKKENRNVPLPYDGRQKGGGRKKTRKKREKKKSSKAMSVRRAGRKKEGEGKELEKKKKKKKGKGEGFPGGTEFRLGKETERKGE